MKRNTMKSNQSGTRELNRVLVLLCLCTLAVCPLSSSAFAQNSSQVEAQKFQRLLNSAHQGDVSSQISLAIAYERGNGTRKNLVTAFQWMQRAALANDAAAQCNLGIYYEYGRGVGKDFPTAVQWYRKSAKQGYARGQLQLGFMYEYGTGVEKDPVQAVRWYRKAAEQGDADGQVGLFRLGRQVRGPHYIQRLTDALGKEADSVNLAKKIERVEEFLADVEREKLLLKALSLREHLHGAYSMETVFVRERLADCLKSFDDHQLRLQLLKQNATIIKREHGETSFLYARELYLVGKAHLDLGDFENAIQCFEQNVQISKTVNDSDLKAFNLRWDKNLTDFKSTFVKSHSGITAKVALANALSKTGHSTKAVSILDECLLSVNKNEGMYLRDICDPRAKEIILNSEAVELSAELLIKSGRYEDALARLDKSGVGISVDRQYLACLALNGKEKILSNLGELFLDYPARYSDVADAYVFLKLWKKAIAAQETVRQKTTRHTVERLPALNDSRRRHYLDDEYHPGLDRALSLGFKQPDNPRAATLSAGWLLNGKGLAHEALAEASLLSTEEAAPFVNKLSEVRSKLSSLSVSDDTGNEANRTRIAALETEQRNLEDKIAEFGLGRQRGETWTPIGTLMTKLPADSCFISIAKFKPIDMEATFKTLEDVWLPERYAAWIVPPVGMGSVKCIDLGEADKVDQAVKAVRTELTSTASRITKQGEAKLESQLRKSLSKLSDLVLTPLMPHLNDSTELIISPDGELWTIPWELLLTEGSDNDRKYLVESKQIRYVMSGRELVNRIEARSVVGAPVVFANPDYDSQLRDQASAQLSKQLALRSTNTTKFAPLAFSAAEAEGIIPSIESYLKKAPTGLLGAKATESAFKNLHRPRVLVLSTHGYFDDSKRIFNPLLRCGLALSGANNRQQATAEGKEDGILTGLEIVGTDLRGTELVVLSACETGLGDITNGEGVAGLRQAFQLAGAQSVISSLWQVEDGETARLMKLFFENLATGKTKSEALRQAQLTRIKARRTRHGAAHPFFWAAFTLTGQD